MGDAQAGGFGGNSQATQASWTTPMAPSTQPGPLLMNSQSFFGDSLPRTPTTTASAKPIPALTHHGIYRRSQRRSAPGTSKRTTAVGANGGRLHLLVFSTPVRHA